MCKIHETLLREGWKPINDYKVVWLKNGEIIYLTNEMIDFIDAIAIENHQVGFEKGAYEQQQQEDAEAAPKAEPEDVAKLDGTNGAYIDFILGDQHHSWVERVRIAKRERTHSDHILKMIETMVQLHATAVENKCFGAAVSIANVISNFNEDLREVLRDDRLTTGGDF
jgi:hypothetical protein